MGVNGLLPKLLEPFSVGRCIDLRHYKHGVSRIVDSSQDDDNNNNNNNKNASHKSGSTTTVSTIATPPLKRPRRGPPRRLRLAIDINTWVMRASLGKGHQLGDSRFFCNFGQQELLKEQEQGLAPQISKEQLHTYTSGCIHYVISRIRQLQTVTDVLVVFDGATPPIKNKTVQERMKLRNKATSERDAPVVVHGNDDSSQTGDEKNNNNNDDVQKRLKAFRRAGAGKHYGHLLDCLVMELRNQQIPFLVSPYESDGQLAYLAERELVDIVVTEDSDLLACGAPNVLYKLLDATPRFNQCESEANEPKPKRQKVANPNDDNNNDNQQDKDEAGPDPHEVIFRGVLVRQKDWGCVRSNSCQLLDFNPALLSVMYVTAGCDYCPSLKGIGIGTANAIVRQAFFRDARQRQARKEHPLRLVLEAIYKKTSDKTKTKDEEFQREYEQDFLAALLMFRHPVVYDPLQCKCVIRNLDQPDVEFVGYEPYKQLLKSYSPNDDDNSSPVVCDSEEQQPKERTLTDIVGPVPPSPFFIHVAEGYLSLKTKQPRGAGEGEKPLVLPDYVQQCLNEMNGVTTAPAATPHDNNRDEHQRAEASSASSSSRPATQGSSLSSTRLATQPGSLSASSPATQQDQHRLSLSQPSTISSLTQSQPSSLSQQTPSQPSQLSQRQPPDGQQHALDDGDDESSFLATQPKDVMAVEDLLSARTPPSSRPSTSLRNTDPKETEALEDSPLPATQPEEPVPKEEEKEDDNENSLASPFPATQPEEPVPKEEEKEDENENSLASPFPTTQPEWSPPPSSNMSSRRDDLPSEGRSIGNEGVLETPDSSQRLETQPRLLEGFKPSRLAQDLSGEDEQEPPHLLADPRPAKDDD